MSNVTPSLATLKKVIDSKYKLPELLRKISPENSYNYGRPCFCPFHDNTRTPAAVIYNDENRDTLWCYTERKLYSVSDVIETLLKKDVYQIGMKLWDAMTELEKEFFKEESLADAFSILDEEDEEEIDLEQEKKRLALLFKHGNITHKQYLDGLLKTIETK